MVGECAREGVVVVGSDHWEDFLVHRAHVGGIEDHRGYGGTDDSLASYLAGVPCDGISDPCSNSLEGMEGVGNSPRPLLRGRGRLLQCYVPWEGPLA